MSTTTRATLLALALALLAAAPAFAQPTAPTPTCLDPLDDAARAGAGWRDLVHQPGPALAGRAHAPRRAPRGVVLAPVGVETRVPLRGPAADRDAPAPWSGASPFARPLPVLADRSGRALVRPGPDADGAVVVLEGEAVRGDVPARVTVAIGADGPVHLARAQAYLASLPAPAVPDGQATRPRRRLAAVFAHDLDRDGTRELIVRTVLEGDAVDGELIVLWADGTSARMDDGSLDGFTLHAWGVGPAAWAGGGAIPLIASAWCCDAVTIVSTTLSPKGTRFAPLQHLVTSGDDPQLCIAPAPGRPRLTLRRTDGTVVTPR